MKIRIGDIVEIYEQLDYYSCISGVQPKCLGKKTVHAMDREFSRVEGRDIYMLEDLKYDYRIGDVAVTGYSNIYYVRLGKFITQSQAYLAQGPKSKLIYDPKFVYDTDIDKLVIDH